VPSDGLLDLNVLRFEHGCAGSFSVAWGVLEFTTGNPAKSICAACTGFEKAGHYSVGITSNEVSRIKSAEEGGGTRESRARIQLGSSSTFGTDTRLGVAAETPTAFSWNSAVQSLAR